MARRLFTSESVTEGHPDKICDQISDAVLDAIYAQDPMGRVACETTACTGLIHIMGEITTSCYVDIAKIARDVVRDIGYDRAKYGFDCDTCAVLTSIDEQSGDIAMGVNNVVGAGLAGGSAVGSNIDHSVVVGCGLDIGTAVEVSIGGQVEDTTQRTLCIGAHACAFHDAVTHNIQHTAAAGNGGAARMGGGHILAV